MFSLALRCDRGPFVSFLCTLGIFHVTNKFGYLVINLLMCYMRMNGKCSLSHMLFISRSGVRVRRFRSGSVDHAGGRRGGCMQEGGAGSALALRPPPASAEEGGETE